MVTKTKIKRKNLATKTKKSTSGVKRKPKTRADLELEVVKNDKEYLKDNIQEDKKKWKILKVFFVVLVISLTSFFIYKYFTTQNNYSIQNKYYGFKLQAPKDWVAEEKTLYSEENIAKILTECTGKKASKNTNYEIGAYRMKNNKEVVLEISIKCIPHTAGDYLSSVLVGGERAKEQILNYPDVGEVKEISFWHNNFQYEIKEYLDSSVTNINELNKIISSFKFTK